MSEGPKLTEANLNKQTPLTKGKDEEGSDIASVSSKGSQGATFLSRVFGSSQSPTTTTTSDVYTGEDKLLKLLQKALTEGKNEDKLKKENANEINNCFHFSI